MTSYNLISKQLLHKYWPISHEVNNNKKWQIFLSKNNAENETERLVPYLFVF